MFVLFSSSVWVYSGSELRGCTGLSCLIVSCEKNFFSQFFCKMSNVTSLTSEILRSSTDIFSKAMAERETIDNMFLLVCKLETRYADKLCYVLKMQRELEDICDVLRARSYHDEEIAEGAYFKFMAQRVEFHKTELKNLEVYKNSIFALYTTLRAKFSSSIMEDTLQRNAVL